MKDSINQFSFYCPSFNVNYDEGGGQELVTERIQHDIKAKLESYVIECDNKFSLDNFEYVTKELGNQKLSDIYQMLGPFDYSAYKEEVDET